MKVGSFQGIPHAYYLRTGRNELRSVQLIKELDRNMAMEAVKITISAEAKQLNADMQRALAARNGDAK